MAVHGPDASTPANAIHATPTPTFHLPRPAVQGEVTARRPKTHRGSPSGNTPAKRRPVASQLGGGPSRGRGAKGKAELPCKVVVGVGSASVVREGRMADGEARALYELRLYDDVAQGELDWTVLREQLKASACPRPVDAPEVVRKLIAPPCLSPSANVGSSGWSSCNGNVTVTQPSGRSSCNGNVTVT